MEIIIIFIGALILLIILAARNAYLDWQDNFSNEYREMMAGYERKKRNGK